MDLIQFDKRNTASLSHVEFERLSRFIYMNCGIKMPPTKKIMLEARLRKRLKDLSLDTFASYCDYLFSKDGMDHELIHMIDVVTTNKTDFFREPNQFTFLTHTALPELMEDGVCGIKRKLKVWSAGCSTGEEPYTLAIVLSEYGNNYPGWDYSILGSDISTQVLEKASLGIYAMDRVEGIPMNLKKKYFLRSKDREKPLVRAAVELRNKLQLKRINFMDDDLGVPDMMDVIFCRNVIIYFDKETQEKLIRKLCRNLVPGGYFFVGHSETLFNMNLPLSQIAPSIYKKYSK